MFIPANANFMFTSIKDISNFDILPTDEIYNAVFDFSVTAPYRNNFVNAGYETSNSILNLRTMFMILLVFIIYNAVLFVIILPLSKRIPKLNDLY